MSAATTGALACPVRVRRAAWFGLLLGCAGPASVAPPARPRSSTAGCDVSAVTAASRRAWLRGGSRPATVLDVRDDRVHVAHVTPGLVVTRWVPRSALLRVVSVPMAISHRPGGPPDENVTLLPGFPVEPVTTPWAHVATSEPGSLDGFVPTSATGWFYEPAPASSDPASGQVIVVRTAPRADAPERAVLDSGARVRIGAEVAPGWFAVTGEGAFTRITGFAQSPPPPRLRRNTSIEFSDVEISGVEDTTWAPTGTCVRDAGGAIAGAIIGPVPTQQVTGGGTAITVAAPWGETRYYVDPPIVRN